jgi:hypothetical protein
MSGSAPPLEEDQIILAIAKLEISLRAWHFTLKLAPVRQAQRAPQKLRSKKREKNTKDREAEPGIGLEIWHRRTQPTQSVYDGVGSIKAREISRQTDRGYEAGSVEEDQIILAIAKLEISLRAWHFTRKLAA